MEEWKVLVKSPEEIQKILNQWKHKYIIHIHSTEYNGVGDSANKLLVILTRILKEN